MKLLFIPFVLFLFVTTEVTAEKRASLKKTKTRKIASQNIMKTSKNDITRIISKFQDDEGGLITQIRSIDSFTYHVEVKSNQSRCYAYRIRMNRTNNRASFLKGKFECL